MAGRGENFSGQSVYPDELLGPLNEVERRYAPSSLWVSGDPDLLNLTSRVAVIGTRNPSEEGIKNAEKITKFLVENDIVVVSGLAKGIDTIVHETAIRLGGRTIGVIGTPLEKFYPSSNKKLQEEIARNHFLLSQFASGSAIQPKNFILRNRTMALFSHASIIIEAGETSGSLSQGWEMLRLNRPLFFLEELVNSKLSWPNKLKDYGAAPLLIENLERVIDHLPVPGVEVHASE